MIPSYAEQLPLRPAPHSPSARAPADRHGAERPFGAFVEKETPETPPAGADAGAKPDEKSAEARPESDAPAPEPHAAPDGATAQRQGDATVPEAAVAPGFAAAQQGGERPGRSEAAPAAAVKPGPAAETAGIAAAPRGGEPPRAREGAAAASAVTGPAEEGAAGADPAADAEAVTARASSGTGTGLAADRKTGDAAAADAEAVTARALSGAEPATGRSSGPAEGATAKRASTVPERTHSVPETGGDALAAAQPQIAEAPRPGAEPSAHRSPASAAVAAVHPGAAGQAPGHPAASRRGVEDRVRRSAEPAPGPAETAAPPSQAKTAATPVVAPLGRAPDADLRSARAEPAGDVLPEGPVTVDARPATAGPAGAAPAAQGAAPAVGLPGLPFQDGDPALAVEARAAEIQADPLLEIAGADHRATPDAAPRAELASRAEAPRIVTTQVAEAAKLLRDGPVELTLSPEELGRVKLTLTAGDGAMVLNVTADRAETLDLLRRNIELLAQDLRDAGFQSLSFSFGGGQDRPDAAPARPAVFAEAPLAAPEAATPIRIAAAGLDLRL